MSLLNKKKPTSAAIARDRLRIILEHERGEHSADLLPMLSRELRTLIERHVQISPDDVQISIDEVDGHEVLEMYVRLPGGVHGAPAA